MAKNKREKGENSGSNKGVGILIGVLIVITWLSVMCLLIKCDVGGFGSRVLRPVFKDVPMINKILPDGYSDHYVPDGFEMDDAQKFERAENFLHVYSSKETE